MITAKVPPRVRVPDVVIGPPVKVNPVLPPEPEMEVTVPPLLDPGVMQGPPVEVAKQGETTPPVNVEVANPITVKLVVVALLALSEPSVAVLAKRFVEPAVVANRFVEVALPMTEVLKFAIVEKRLVLVAFVVVEFVAIRLVNQPVKA